VQLINPVDFLQQQNMYTAAKIMTTRVNLAVRYVPPSAAESDGRWEVLVDGRPVGYYPDKETFGPSGLQPDRAAWWGEVTSTGKCASTGEAATCTGMGNGKPGTEEGAARFTNLVVEGDTNHSSRQMYVTKPALYSSDEYSESDASHALDGNSFGYGGPGFCQSKETVTGSGATSKTVDPPTTTENPKRKDSKPLVPAERSNSPEQAEQSSTVSEQEQQNNTRQETQDSPEQQVSEEQQSNESSGESSCPDGISQWLCASWELE
jgi:hypothetical protein